MKHFITLACVILISCGGGGGSVAAPNSNQATSSTINFSGTGGDFQAAQPIHIDYEKINETKNTIYIYSLIPKFYFYSHRF